MFTAILFSACSEVDPIIDMATGPNSISAKINGENFSASGILVTAEYSTTTSGTVQTLAIGAAKLPLNGVTTAIALAVVALDSSDFQSGAIFVATDSSRLAAGEYSLDDNSVDIKAVSSNTDVATITLTEIDFTNKTVSGTFSFDGADDDDPNTIYEVREGVFTEIPFR